MIPANTAKSLAMVFCLASSALAGCSSGNEVAKTPQPTPTSRWDGVVADLRYVWSAEPGIELVTGPAVPIRAYVESFALVQQTGDIDKLYPGFDKAVAPNGSDDGPRHALGLWPETEYALRSPRVGTSRQHILSVTRDEHEVVVVTCTWDYTTARATDDDKYSFQPSGAASPETAGISALRITMTPPDIGNNDLPPQSGPSPSPSTDVFGQWRITGKLNPRGELRDDEWPTSQQDVAQCVAKAPDPVDRRTVLVTGEHPRADFPTEAPHPGWPS